MLSNLLPKLNDYEYKLLIYCLKVVKKGHVLKDDLTSLLDKIEDRTINLNNFKGE